MLRNQKLQKTTAYCITLITVLVLFFSTIYLVEHAHHDCSGHDCPICLVMHKCSNNIKTIGSAIILVSCSVLLVLTTILKNELYSINIILCNSLVLKKVRMDN